MKKTISKIFLGMGAMICTMAANAQWTTTGTVIRPVTLTNNVSIGTTVNGANLYVEKSTAVTLGIKSTTAGATMFMDKGSATANAAFAYKLGGVTQWNSGMLGNNNYSIRNVPASTFPLIIDLATDNVLINSTDIPGSGVATYPLTLKTGATTALGLDNGASIFVKNNVGNYEPFLWPQWTDNKTYMNYGAGGFDIRNSGSSTAMYMTADRKVGIGTGAPSASLHVVGNEYVEGARPSFSTAVDNNMYISNSNTGYAGLSLFPSTNSLDGASIFGGTGGIGLNVVVANSGVNYGPINASAFNVASDRRMKKEIVDINSDSYEKYMTYIRNIESATFRYKTETDAVRNCQHIGLIAQSLPVELQSRITESPTEQSEDRIAVNLADLSGLLVVGVKALDAKQIAYEKTIADLQTQIDILKQQQSQNSNGENKLTQNTDNRLFQNQPNPFNQNTIIRFALNAESQNAVIVIRDLNGVSIKQINLRKSNNGQVVINASELKQGTYTYSLEVNGNSIDTKLMVVTK
nr:tail fiber domain-containing protein [Bacteroidota bacterium]